MGRKGKERFSQAAYEHLDAITVLSARKEPLRDLAGFLLTRQH